MAKYMGTIIFTFAALRHEMVSRIAIEVLGRGHQSEKSPKKKQMDKLGLMC